VQVFLVERVRVSGSGREHEAYVEDCRRCC
jgi:hypothetical protein